MLTHIDPPESNEFAPYYEEYIKRVRGKDVLAVLAAQVDEINSKLGSLSDKQALFRDAPKEWSIKQVLGHIVDVERVFSYRLLRISRGDSTPLPGFEQNDFVDSANFEATPIKDLVEEFEHLRHANLLAIRNMKPEMLTLLGTASNNPVSARALVYQLAGHVHHHMESLYEKYLPNVK